MPPYLFNDNRTNNNKLWIVTKMQKYSATKTKYTGIHAHIHIQKLCMI